jgi:hypothetical protein
MRKQKICLIFLISAIIPVTAILLTRTVSCSSQIEVSSGLHPQGAQSWKASLQRLSQEIQRCPKAEEFIIRYKVPLGPSVFAHAASSFRSDTQKTMYSRRDRIIIADRYAEGSNYVFVNVTDEAINSVAAKNGSFEDLTQFGCKDQSP